MIKFDPIEHKYTLNGKVIPSVTQVINGVLKGEKEWEGSSEAMNFGTCVHKTLEYHDQGILEEYDPRMNPYITQWKSFLNDYTVRITAIEFQTYSNEYIVAGTIDRVCIIGNKWCILDIKTGKSYKEHSLQTMGYNLIYDVNLKMDRMCVYLSDEGYRIEKHEDFDNDFATFKAILKVWNWKKGKL